MAGSMPFPPFPNLPFDGPVTWPDPPGAAQRAPGRWPTVRVRTFTGGGYAVSVADSANDRFTLIEGSATSARVVHVNGGQWSETVAVTAGVPGVSSVVTRIGADPAGLLTGAARTVFTTGVVRQDSASSATGHIAAWTFPDGRSSQVTWGVDGRHEMVTSGPQGKIRRLLHTVADGPGRRVTQITDEAGNELGSTVAAFGFGGSVQLDTIGASGGVVAGKQPFDTTDSNGQRTWGELTVFESGAKEYQVYTSGPQGVGTGTFTYGTDGTFTQEGWKSTPTPDGDVLMKTHYKAEADGSVHDYDVSLTNQQTGASKTFTAGYDPDGNPFQSAATSDGQGNGQQKTITYHTDDDGFEVTTDTKVGGTSTIDHKTYDGEGHDITPSGSSGGGTPPHRDDEPPDHPAGSPPYDDGSDWGPPHSGGGDLTSLLRELLFGHSTGWPGQGDPNPAAGKAGEPGSLTEAVSAIKSQLTAVISIDGGTGFDGGRGGLGRDTGGHPIPGVALDQALDTPAIVDSPYWGDPNNPQSLITAVVRISGPEAARIARTAAEFAS